jgi:hypothetical protein
MKIPMSIRYFKKDQRLEFRCPFCSQLQSWNGSVRVESDDSVYPDPKVAFERHVLGNNDGSELCLVRPSIDEIEEYRPVARINT